MKSISILLKKHVPGKDIKYGCNLTAEYAYCSLWCNHNWVLWVYNSLWVINQEAETIVLTQWFYKFVSKNQKIYKFSCWLLFVLNFFFIAYVSLNHNDIIYFYQYVDAIWQRNPEMGSYLKVNLLTKETRTIKAHDGTTMQVRYNNNEFILFQILLQLQC